MRFNFIYSFLTVIIIIFVSCYNQKMSTSGSISLDKQGHRGCRGLMPENTIPAMMKAIDLGVTTLEMDAVITSDHEVILSHEPFFNPEISTHADGKPVSQQEALNLNIYKMTLAETQMFDVGLKPHPRFPRQQKMAVTKPTLSLLIDSVEKYVADNKRSLPYYNIETKSTPATDNLYHPSPAVFVKLLMDVIVARGIQSRVIIQSFDRRTIQEVRRSYPGIVTSLLIEDWDSTNFSTQLRLCGFTPEIYSPHYSHVNEQLIKDCHARKMRIIPWTVNDKKEIDRLKGMGVDGIITDYPDLFD